MYVDTLIPMCLISISLSQMVTNLDEKEGCSLVGRLKPPILKLGETGFVGKVMFPQQTSANPREY